MDWFLIFIVGLLCLPLLGWIYLIQIQHDRRKSAKAKLIKEEFDHIFSGTGDSFIAFNTHTGRFKFGTLSDFPYTERPISLISNYELKENPTYSQKIDYKFFFYISDIENYMHEIFYHDSERLAEKEWAKLQAVYEECISSQYSEVENVNKIEEYDFFVSHASEDKDSFVRPLVYALTALGLKVWYDEFTLEVGDSLRRSIDHGLGSSKYVIVVLSKSFFSKQWTQYELDASVNRSMNGNKVILPIWHNVKREEVSCYSHSLADKVAYITSENSIEQMAQKLLKLLEHNS
jgi:TIR domain